MPDHATSPEPPPTVPTVTAPDGWEPGDRAYPYFDDRTASLVVAHHGPDREWMVSVAPMLFNDRVLLSHREHYPRTWVAGFCYPKGPAAVLAAQAWDPTREDYPAGFARLAADSRDPADLPSAHHGHPGREVTSRPVADG